MSKVKLRLLVFTATLLLLGLSEGLHSRTSMGIGPGYKDPGVRTGTDDAGGSLPGLTPNEEKFFQAGGLYFVRRIFLFQHFVWISRSFGVNPAHHAGPGVACCATGG